MTITSAATSINKTRPPAYIKLVEKAVGWKNNTNHLDLGCGKYPEIIAKTLKEYGVNYIGVDPYNRTEMENDLAWDLVETMEGVNTASLSNVLNVIQASQSRHHLIKKAWRWLRKGGYLFVTVHEGDKSGKGRVSKKDCWQENRKTVSYLPELEEVFGKDNVIRKGKLLIAKKP